MTIVCTICSAENRADEELQPAVDRYLSERIRWVHAESRRLERPFVILSGKYGLLGPDERIPS